MFSFCSDGKTRTYDLHFIRVALCQLSYVTAPVPPITSRGAWMSRQRAPPPDIFLYAKPLLKVAFGAKNIFKNLETGMD